MSRKALMVSSLVILFLAGGVYWYLGYSFDFSRFFAAEVGELNIQCGANQNVLSWTVDDRANSNGVQRGNGGAKNLPDCADFWCWLPTINFNHQVPTTGSPAQYTDNQLQSGVCYTYRVKYQPSLPSNEVVCPSGCNVVSSPSPSATPTPGSLAVQCTAQATGGTNRLTWTYYSRANSNGVERGNTGTKNLPDCADFWCWLPTISYTHQVPTPAQPANYDDNQLQSGVCYTYRVKYQPGLPSNEVQCCVPQTTHKECSSNACVVVNGAGTDTCATDANCAAAPTATVAAVCDTPDVTRTTVTWATTGTPTTNILQRQVDGGAFAAIYQENGPPFTRDSYADTQITLGHTYGYRVQVAPNVFSNVATVVANAANCNVQLTHKACANNACVVVNGAGSDTCSTSADCATPTHLACVNNACVSVTGAGTNLCSTNANCASPTHLECRNESCVTVNGSGGNECTTNSDCRPDRLICTPVNQDADVNETVEVRVSGGTPPYSWSAAGSALLQQSSSRVSVRYNRGGSFPVAVSDSSGRSAVCYVNVQAPVTYIPPPPTYIPPPTYVPPVTQVPTGPGETTVLALIISSIITLLYVGYTGTDAFRRRELKSNIDVARRDKDQFNFKK